MIKRIAAIAVAVKNADAAAEACIKFLGMEKKKEYELPEAGIRKGVALQVGKNIFYELVEPSDVDSPLKRFIETRGEGIFQIAVHSDNIEEEVKVLEAKGARASKMVIDKERGVISGYISPKSLNGVMVEITSEDAWPYPLMPPLP